MEKVTDWILLWKQLVESQSHTWEKRESSEGESDHWRGKAQSFNNGVKQRWAKPDSHREFVLSLLKRHQGSTVLDIGAGTGGWAVPMARLAKKVTAIEPSSEMIRFMTDNLKSEGVGNVEIVQATRGESILLFPALMLRQSRCTRTVTASAWATLDRRPLQS